MGKAVKRWNHESWEVCIDYKNLQGSNDPWYCVSCCDEILPFVTLINKNSLSLVNPPPDDHGCFTSNSDTYINKNSSLLKPSSGLSLPFNQFNNSFPEQKTDPENVVNFNYYDTDQLQTLKFPESNKL